MKKSCIAIIPARGGSKRIPRKNIREFCGIPIIEYSISAAIESKLFDEVMVSTDDIEISEVSKKAGAKIPFMRSEHTANDTAGLVEVIDEVLNAYKSREQSYAYFCCILPTAPFITVDRLKESYEILLDQTFDSVFPIVKFGYPIQRSLSFNNGHISMLWPENYSKRSQDLPITYHDTGQFYWMKTETFFLKKSLFTENSGAIMLTEFESQDIDSEEDWEIAEVKYLQLKK